MHQDDPAAVHEAEDDFSDLSDLAPDIAEPPPAPRYEFQLTDHCCIWDGGRILRRSDGMFMCCDCETDARQVRQLCCCGLVPVGGHCGHPRLRPFFRCGINIEVWPGRTARIVNTFGTRFNRAVVDPSDPNIICAAGR